jgi:hypothetical protein
MDCHINPTSSSTYQLVGVFAEKQGLAEFTAQLFPHEAYCRWRGRNTTTTTSAVSSGTYSNNTSGAAAQQPQDVYTMMQNARSTLWSSGSGCTLMDMTDESGNDLYRDIRPRRNGDVGYGLYYDSLCTKVAAMSYGDYLEIYYTYFSDAGGGSSSNQQQYQAAIAQRTKYETAISNWNQYMSEYKVCQPCRAYSKTASSTPTSSSTTSSSSSKLGNGSAQPHGFNCYDDMGYTNVNQVCVFCVRLCTSIPHCNYSFSLSVCVCVCVCVFASLYWAICVQSAFWPLSVSNR